MPPKKEAEPKRNDLQVEVWRDGRRWWWRVWEYKHGFFDEEGRREIDWYPCANRRSDLRLGNVEGREKTELAAIRSGLRALYVERADRIADAAAEQAINDTRRVFS